MRILHMQLDLQPYYVMYFHAINISCLILGMGDGTVCRECQWLQETVGFCPERDLIQL
jgi:hypothetical protein